MNHSDYELGDQPIEVERRPRSGVVISVRLSAEEADLLSDVAEANGKTVSQVTREALTRYLREPVKSAQQTPSWTGTSTGSSNLEITSGPSAPKTRGQMIDPATLIRTAHP